MIDYVTIMYSTNDYESHYQEAKQQSERIFLRCRFRWIAGL